MEHSDLVSEMVQVEHLTTQERLHLARRRRIQQLKVWSQREKEWLRSRPKKEKSMKRNIFFSDSVMLLEAAARNDIEEVRRLLSRGVTPDATNEDGLTALHQCCIDNNEAMLRLLLEHGADVNAEDSERWTPLHAAATCGNLQLVRILIQHGANLLAVNGDGNMPYDICEDEATLDAIEGEMAARGVTQRLIDETRSATERHMLTDVRRLVASGADLDEMRDAQGATLLHIAAANGYLKVVECLLENRASTDVIDFDQWQPVHAAACWGHLEVLEMLVQYGADLNVRNKHDETPADICEETEMRARVTRLAAEQEEWRRRAAAAARHSGSSDRIRGARRSSSTASGSRVRSVRRTSLREKQLAAKQDVRGEARLRETFDAADPDQGFSSGVENDQNAANQVKNVEGLHKRSSNSSSLSNQSSYDSSNDDYLTPKLPHSGQQPRNAIYEHNIEPHQHLYHPQHKHMYAQGGVPNPSAMQSTYSKSESQIGEKQNVSNKLVHSKGETRSISANPMPNGIRKAPEGQDNESYLHEDEVDGENKDLMLSNKVSSIGESETTHYNQVSGMGETEATHYTTDNNGKINVHVTVMINAGTLADLKKQRSQIRTNGSPVETHPPSPTGDMPPQRNPLTINDAPLPPARTVPRFIGHTGDVVGDTRSNRCCVIM